MSDSKVRDLLAQATTALQAITSASSSPPTIKPLGERDLSEVRREAELLLQHALRVDRAWLFAHADDEVQPDFAGQFRCYVSRRVAGEPIAYITGRREFFSLDLVVTPDVLIPRPETELLVEQALDKIPWDRVVQVADVGTGSGAIALAVAHERPQARVLATDVSAAALDVARSNAQRLGLINVEFALGEWCAALGERKFDAILSNPPYIALGDAHLGEGDLRFEPALALSSGTDGLDAIRTIARDAKRHLEPGGWLIVEHGYDQGFAVRAIFSALAYADPATFQDLEGRDRISAARYDPAPA